MALIQFLPLQSSIIAGFFGKFQGQKGVNFITTFLLTLTMFICIFTFKIIAQEHIIFKISFISWIQSESLFVEWNLFFDSLSGTMQVVITSISTQVHLYSISYMEGDPHTNRFMSYLSLFTFFMIVLVTADNYLQQFVGWEGVGLCSYLLINFWFTRIQANKAAIQAMLVNRIGDIFLAQGLIAIYFEFKTLDYAIVFSIVPLIQEKTVFFLNIEVKSLTLIGLLLFIGAVGKSAQVGLHVWLPNAMEGPTPVSALIHAATMVTAGVFLLARSSPLQEYTSFTQEIITFLGAITAFFAASTGFLQNDLKKIIAYSTCSQQGYMMLACGLSAYGQAVFHLSNHAFFKALLFLSAGSVIHALGDEQDIRRMGGLLKFLPFTYSMFFIGSFALMGFPFLTGFYSKDLILEIAYVSFTIPGSFAHWLGSQAAFFTAFYSIRLQYQVFIIKPAGFKKAIESTHEGSFKILFPLFLQAFASIFLGFITKELFVGQGSTFQSQAIFTHPLNNLYIDAEFISPLVKNIPIFFSLVGTFCSYFIYNSQNITFFKYKTVSYIGNTLYVFFNRKWLFDKIYSEFIIIPSIVMTYKITYRLIDKGILEAFGPYGLTTLKLKNSFSYIQTGNFYHYTLLIILAITFPIFFVLPFTTVKNVFQVFFFILSLIVLEK